MSAFSGICSQQPNTTTFEEIAVEYFADSIIKSGSRLKYMNFCYDGKVKTVSKSDENLILAKNTPKYKEILEFEESYLNNNSEDFEILVPHKIKSVTWNEFQGNHNLNKYFLNVKHHIKSRKKNLVQINIYSNFIKGDQLYMSFYIYINPVSLKVINYSSPSIMDLSPPYIFIKNNTSFFGKVLEVDGYKKNRPSGHIALSLRYIYVKFWMQKSKNLLYEQNELKKILKRNDSIVKYHKNDTLFIHRKDSAYYFILGKEINKKE